MIRPYCKTDLAFFMVGIKDEKGVMRFPDDKNVRPGIFIEVKPLIPINELMVDGLKRVLGPDWKPDFNICQELSEEIELEDGRSATVYVGTVPDHSFQAPGDWPSMPDILRSMPKNKGRISYLKAWQVLTGGLTINTKVLEAEEVLNSSWFDETPPTEESDT